MQTLKNKIKDNNGASIILALLFFLFAMAVGSVILASASVNLGRTQAMTNQEQNYLAVKSAASLIEKELSALTLKATHQTEEDFNEFGVGGGSSIVAGSMNVEYVVLKSDGTLDTTATIPDYAKDMNMILGSLKKAYEAKVNNTAYSSSDMYMVFEVGSMPNVKAKINVNKDYSIKIVFWCDGSDPSNADDSNVLTLNLPVTVSEKTETNVPSTDFGNLNTTHTTTYSTLVSYRNPNMVKGGSI